MSKLLQKVVKVVRVAGVINVKKAVRAESDYNFYKYTAIPAIGPIVLLKQVRNMGCWK